MCSKAANTTEVGDQVTPVTPWEKVAAMLVVCYTHRHVYQVKGNYLLAFARPTVIPAVPS